MEVKKLQSQLREEAFKNYFTYQSVLYRKAANRIDQLEQKVERATEQFRNTLQEASCYY